jgi:trans-2,3-dihydro-3-hydroxyanthranilate isomerase
VDLYDNGPRHVMVAVSSPAAVSRLKPDIRRLAEWPLAFSVFDGREREWRTRVFCPGLDVVEDPATGSAAGPLALHQVRYGLADFGEELRIEQGESIGRPSVLFARVAGEGDRVTRVEVGGSAVVVGRGELVLPV